MPIVYGGLDFFGVIQFVFMVSPSKRWFDAEDIAVAVSYDDATKTIEEIVAKTFRNRLLLLSRQPLARKFQSWIKLYRSWLWRIVEICNLY